jgi:hypothetical protein
VTFSPPSSTDPAAIFNPREKAASLLCQERGKRRTR